MERALCPVLIGREAEIGILEDALLGANRGQGQVVLLAGDAGMGKTRLATELERRARTLGMTVILGGCSAADLALPYLPFVEAVGNHLATQDLEALRLRLGPVRRELGHLFPQLEPEGVPPDVDGAQGRLRLFEALLALLRIPADDQGLLVVVEDLHWADASTRELLDYLTRRLRGARIMVLGTYRGDEMHRKHPLLPMIQAWRRSSAATVVELEPLSPERVAAMVKAIFDLTEIADDTRDFLHRRSEGNPFVLEEMLKAALDRGEIFRKDGSWTRKALSEMSIPETVRDTILMRLDRLEEGHVEVLRAASALGATFTYASLVKLSGLPESEVGKAVEASVRQQLLRDEPGQEGRYGFRHALTREAIYEDIIVPHRQQLHGRAADILAAAGAAAVEVTFHLLAGGRIGEAIPLCLQAATEAEAAYAQRDAADLYLTVLPHIVDHLERADVMCRLGEALHIAGEVVQARSYLETGLPALEGVDAIRAAHYRLVLGRCLWESNRSDLALAAYETSREVLEAHGPSTDLAIAYARLAGLRTFAFDAPGALLLAERARQIADEVGDRGLAAWATSFAALAMHAADRADEAIVMIDRSYQEALAGGYPVFAENALYNGIILRVVGYRNREVPARLVLMRNLAGSRLAEGNAHLLEGIHFQLSGRPAAGQEALLKAESAFLDAEAATSLGRARLFQVGTLTDLDRLDEARARLDSAGQFAEAQERFRKLWETLRLAVAAGDGESARKQVTMVTEVAGWGAAQVATIGMVLIDALVAFGYSEEAQTAAVAVGELGERERPLADFISGRMAAIAGDHRSAVPLLESARDFFAEVEYRTDEWRARQRLAESLAQIGDREAARTELETILSMARERSSFMQARQASEALLALGFEVPTADLESTPAQPAGAGIPTGERLVTVLFADVRGFTALSAEGVPAETADRIGALQRWAADEVGRHHGLIDKFAGDAVMATFNFSGATVDHAAHAVEAALAIRDKAALLGLPVGIGIATGPAIVGQLAPGANVSVLGIATNLASRLQAQAGEGEVIIGDDTFQRLQSWLTEHSRKADAEHFSLKGFEQPVRAHRLR